MKISDKLWIWGLDPGADHYGGENALAGSNRMTPIEACDYFSARNIIRVSKHGYPKRPYDREADRLSLMDRVVWAVDPEDEAMVSDVIRIAKYHKNIQGILLLTDHSHKDFYRRGTHFYESFRKRVKDELGEDFPIWIQVHAMKVCALTKPYTDTADVLYLCPPTAEECANLTLYREILDRWTEPGTKQVWGCVFWDFKNRKIMSSYATRQYLTTYLDWLKKGDIEGICLYGNTLADTKLGAAFEAKAWADVYAKEEL
ncbi:MAG: hypothetical protein PUB07_07095 [Clostridia bacterium]|nr:hypothetical protein [Clostridia bacterium]